MDAMRGSHTAQLTHTHINTSDGHVWAAECHVCLCECVSVLCVAADSTVASAQPGSSGQSVSRDQSVTGGGWVIAR